MTGQSNLDLELEILRIQFTKEIQRVWKKYVKKIDEIKNKKTKRRNKK